MFRFHKGSADLLGRRRVRVTGLVVFAGASLTGGLAHSSSLPISALFAQGSAPAMLSPAALSGSRKRRTFASLFVVHGG